MFSVYTKIPYRLNQLCLLVISLIPPAAVDAYKQVCDTAFEMIKGASRCP